MGKYYKVLLPIFYIGIIGVMVACILLVITGIKNYVEDSNKTKFTLDSVFEDIVEPVNKTESNTIIKPFTSDKVKVGRTFYEYKSEAKKQESSLIVYENTYMQNNGVDYVCSDEFDVVSVLAGEIISIEDNDVYGKVVTIKHNENLTSVYSNIKSITAKVGYKISQGEILGVSNKSSLESSDKNMLHFEVYYKGNSIDPENLYTMSVSDFE